VIRSPINGIVLKQYFKTTGGVVGAGQPIFDIVPTEENLTIDARIFPRDIDDVHVGMSGYVMFPSYPQRNLFRVPGRIERMSPDTLQDEKTGERYFTARVEVDREELRRIAPGIELTPGLPAEVYIATIDRTVIEYILQPLLQTIERSMRER
jgi:HlyD family secretion protein